MRIKRVWLVAVGVCALVVAAIVAGSAISASGTSVVPRAGTGAPQTGDFTPSGTNDATDEEFAGEDDGGEGPDAYGGNIVDRSLSSGPGKPGRGTSTASTSRTTAPTRAA